MTQTAAHEAKVKELEQQLAHAKVELELQKQANETLSKEKEAVGSLAQSMQLSTAGIHLHVHLPHMPDMPNMLRSYQHEEEQQGPAPRALDVRVISPKVLKICLKDQQKSSSYMRKGFGVPLEILSDRGLGFRGDRVGELLKKLKIKRRHSTAYYPQCNGLVEKVNELWFELPPKTEEGEENGSSSIQHYEEPIEALLKEECEDIFWQEEMGYDFGNSYLEGLSIDVPLVNAITDCICYDNFMGCEINAIFAPHAEFYDVEVQRYLMNPIQIDKQKPIQDVFPKMCFKSSQHSEVRDLKPYTDEKDSKLMQMLDEVSKDFRPSLCQDVIQKEVGNAMEPTEVSDAMDSFGLLILLEDLVSRGEGDSSLMMENLELLPYELGGVVDPLQVFGLALSFDNNGSTYFIAEGSYDSNDLHPDIYLPYDLGGCFGIPMQSYFFFMTWDPGGGYDEDFIGHYISMFFVENALLMHCCLYSTTNKLF
ncbi:hypothetical protein L7F22_059870 [Adiantum nelumboides]|nr:hypothetical protein [Adiantum nelumboides]